MADPDDMRDHRTAFHDGFPFNRRKSEAMPPPVASAIAPESAPVLTPARSTTPPPIPARDRRRSPRQTLVARAMVRSERSLAVACGYVSNISMNGIAFHTRRPLAAGEHFHIRIELGPMKWTNRLRVVTCREHAESGTFDVGAEFVGNELVVSGKQAA